VRTSQSIDIHNANLFSHAQRLQDISNANATSVSAPNALDQQLTDATTNIIQKFEEIADHQKRNDSLSAENARLNQQLTDKDAQLVEHVNSQHDLLSAKAALEEKVQKAGEDCERLKERLEGLSRPSAPQELPVPTVQIAILSNDNLYLKGEVKELKEKHETVKKARNELLKQVDNLQVSLISTQCWIKTDKA